MGQYLGLSKLHHHSIAISKSKHASCRWRSHTAETTGIERQEEVGAPVFGRLRRHPCSDRGPQQKAAACQQCRQFAFWLGGGILIHVPFGSLEPIRAAQASV